MYIDTVLSNRGSPELQRNEYPYAYVASFIRPDDPNDPAQAADNLAFWRSYGRDGGGCSLIVSVPRQVLQAVKYGRETTRRLQSPIDDLQKAANAIASKIGAAPQSLYELYDPAMEKIRYLYKSEAYDYEKECRVVETPLTIEGTIMDPIFEFSGPPGQETVKRYIQHPELAMKKIFVSESVITLGPQVPNANDAKEYIEGLIREARGDDTVPTARVDISTIPYRRSNNH